MKDTSGFTIKVYRRIENIPRHEWERIYPRALENYDFFKAVDESGFEGFSHYYVLVYKDGLAVGAAPCFLMDYPLEATVEGPVRKLLSRLGKIFPSLFNIKALVSGSPVAEGRIGLDEEDREQILTAIVEGMERIAEDEGARLLGFKDFSSDYTDLFDTLLARGFHKMESFPSVGMDINFKSFDEYLKGLSRATRKDLRRKFKRVDDVVKIDLEVSNSLDGELDEAYELYKKTCSRSGARFETVPKSFFRNISIHMPDRTKYFRWRIKDKLVAFNFCMASRDTLIDGYIGLDYPVALQYHLYFITFRDLMKWCMDNNIKRYETGPLNYEPKKRLDCEFNPLHIYFRHNNRFANMVLGILRRCLKPLNFNSILKEMKKRGRL